MVPTFLNYLNVFFGISFIPYTILSLWIKAHSLLWKIFLNADWMFVYKIKLQRKISTNQRADICMCSWTVRNVCFCTFKRAFNFQRPETGNFDSCICSAVVSKCYFITFAVMSTWFCVHCDPGLKTRDLKLDFVRFLLAPEKKKEVLLLWSLWDNQNWICQKFKEFQEALLLEVRKNLLLGLGSAEQQNLQLLLNRLSFAPFTSPPVIISSPWSRDPASSYNNISS